MATPACASYRMPSTLPDLLRAYDELEAIYTDFRQGRTIAARKTARATLEAMGLTKDNVGERFADLAKRIEQLDPSALTPDMRKLLAEARRLERLREHERQYAAEDAVVPEHEVGAWLQPAPRPDPAAVAWPGEPGDGGRVAPGLAPLLDLHLDRPELAFLQLPPGRLRICVKRANIWQPLWTRVRLDGSASPLTELEPSDRIDPDLEHLRPLYLRPEQVPSAQLVGGQVPAEGIADERADSYVGGLPHWQQYAETPLCPDCHNPMTFVGQVAHAFGVLHYAFVCPKCLVASVVYQQD